MHFKYLAKKKKISVLLCPSCPTTGLWWLIWGVEAGEVCSLPPGVWGTNENAAHRKEQAFLSQRRDRARSAAAVGVCSPKIPPATTQGHWPASTPPRVQMEGMSLWGQVDSGRARGCLIHGAVGSVRISTTHVSQKHLKFRRN